MVITTITILIITGIMARITVTMEVADIMVTTGEDRVDIMEDTVVEVDMAEAIVVVDTAVDMVVAATEAINLNI
jgi:hypothetical protein